MEILYNVLTVSGGLSGVAGLIMCWVVYRQFAAERRAREEEADQRKKLAGKLETLELEKFARLEKQVTEHLQLNSAGKSGLQMPPDAIFSRNGAKPPFKADTAQTVQFPKVSRASAKTSPRAGSSAKKIRRTTGFNLGLRKFSLVFSSVE